MKSEEIRQYLDRSLLARLAITDAGWPHVVPVWFEFDGEKFWIPAQAKTAKVEHIRKDKRKLDNRFLRETHQQIQYHASHGQARSRTSQRPRSGNQSI
jgi:nitroimidazol reductase NimA-like FMN-containing flavoprotein (pyridoxamine 5'-phosphate oxidase superfamily)